MNRMLIVVSTVAVVAGLACYSSDVSDAEANGVVGGTTADCGYQYDTTERLYCPDDRALCNGTSVNCSTVSVVSLAPGSPGPRTARKEPFKTPCFVCTYQSCGGVDQVKEANQCKTTSSSL